MAAESGEFEVGVSIYGQTKEHPLLAYTLGVKQMICCVNKMDSVSWSQSRYSEIVSEVCTYLKKVGYDPHKIPFIPISGLLGDNLGERSANLQWYTGPCLLEALDMVTPPKRCIEKPLRIPVSDVSKISGVGTVTVGRVMTGVLKPGMIVIFAPGNVSGEVRSVERHHQELTEAVAGDYVGFHVKNVSVREIHRGYVASDPTNDPARTCASFNAQVVVLRHPTLIYAGYTPVIHCHTAHIACRFDRIISKIDLHTGAVLEEDPPFIKTGDAAMVSLIPQNDMCVETFSDYPRLGRFAVRDSKQTVAVGIIKSLTKR